ncbi:HEXXH motif domain-containing protein [Sphaerisporangium fuscum]|uniref:HEXXH motif domain-containing protein n=1 Tax=Sphaerisporangium fuscum TaxID=2835868 RepID=UPI001BDD3F2C|nr:HEXXH motif domain-containing protein [Sphaerisporangium fuscum]
MTPRRHTLPAELFARIAAGGGGAEAARLLTAAEYSKRLVLLRAVMERAPAERAGVSGGAGAVRQAYDLLVALQRTTPAAVRHVIGHPAVGVWALHTLRGPRDASTGPGRLAALAAGAAVLARVPISLTVTVERLAPGRCGVMLPSLGFAALPGTRAGDPAVVRVGPSGAAVEAAGHLVPIPPDPFAEDGAWLGLRRLSAGTGPHAVRFLVDDVDPFRFPLVRRCAPRLPAGELSRWQAVVECGRRLLAGVHPEVAAEVSAGVGVLVPLLGAPGEVTSATSPEGFGCVALSRPSDARALTQTLAHEVQHGKLTALGTLFPLVAEPDGERFYAPWREDPRPVGGLLQGAYAHLGLALFWERQRHAETQRTARLHAQTEFARWRDATASVVRVLLTGRRLTPLGERFATGMLATLDALRAAPVSPRAARRAAHLLADHRTRWQARNGRREPA